MDIDDLLARVRERRGGCKGRGLEKPGRPVRRAYIIADVRAALSEGLGGEQRVESVGCPGWIAGLTSVAALKREEHRFP